MAIATEDLLKKLDPIDLKKVEYFLQLLLRQEKYKALQKEIEDRRKEIANGDVLTHDDLWKQMNV